MDMIRIVALGLLATFMAVEMKSHKPVYGIIIAVTTAIFLLFLSLDKIETLLGGLGQLFEKAGESTYISLLIKALGISYLCEISAGICQDAGVSSLASQIKIFAKVYIIILGLPILLAFVDVLDAFQF